jgi:excisionase family DNA binding protein
MNLNHIELTPDQYAETIGYHRESIPHWLRTGELKAHKTGPRTYRIPFPEWQRFVNERRMVTR